MKKQYSKKQILEAINYWQKQLKTINESKYDLISILSNKYGNELVLKDNRIFKLDTNIAQDLFNIFNKYIFNLKLPPVEILCEPYTKIVVKLKHRNADIPQNGFYGMFNTIAEDEYLTTLNDKLEYKDNLIIINNSLVNNSNFIFACSSLCHEMIHYYGKIYGEESLCDKYWLLYKIKIDSHTTPTFISMQRKANDMGLTVINDGAGFNFSELNSEAFKNMMNSIVNDGLDLEEDESLCEKQTIMSNKMLSGGISISHIDYI